MSDYDTLKTIEILHYTVKMTSKALKRTKQCLTKIDSKWDIERQSMLKVIH